VRIVLPLRAALVASHLVVLTLPWLALLGTGALGWDLVRQTRTELELQAAVLSVLVKDELAEAKALDATSTLHQLELSPRLRSIREETLAGIRVLDPHGIVAASSGDGLGDNLSGQPEVVKALAGLPSAVVRPRDGAPITAVLSGPQRRARVRVFATRPVVVDGELAAVLLLSRTPREEVQALIHMAPRLGWGALLGLGLTTLLAFYVGYRFSRSLRLLARTSHRLAGGDMEAAEALDLAAHSHLSEVRELSAAVATMTDRLRERLAYIAEFAGNVSHEFKTPISTLRGTVELLRDDADMPAEQRALFLDNAQADLERMERLVTGLLALARAEEPSAHVPVSLDDLVDRVIARFPDVKRGGAAGSIVGTPAQLEAVIGNLIDNAYRHGGDDVAVTVTTWVHGARVGVDVIDNGAGISIGNRARIFERFFTTDRQGGGTGLGLALAQAVCRAHGGGISLESEPGRTCFRVSLLGG